MFVIKAHKTLPDRGSYKAHSVLKELDGSFGFILYDLNSKNMKYTKIYQALSLDGVPEINILIILDRELDMVTPMCTQLTYEGLLDKVFFGENASFIDFYKTDHYSSAKLPIISDIPEGCVVIRELQYPIFLHIYTSMKLICLLQEIKLAFPRYGTRLGQRLIGLLACSGTVKDAILYFMYPSYHYSWLFAS
ncbi:hypothetical protein L1987_01911 [Smallanthus sonchifolius]|uniref:Uncharacterized protein n=1 Tax=Smallanthus sonchifolius TaxID=185202 RepID=A0ACB9K6L0_9ASTR|nr:hypothetical protein L1987_01911 [Smallanthus sonchifolius]